MTEREKELQRIRDEAKARMENRVGALTRTRVLSKDDWRERVNTVSDESITQFLSASPTTSSIPTFTEQKATNLSKAREAMDLGGSTSLPKVKWGERQPDRTIAQKALSLPREDKTQAQQDIVKSFLFGKNNNKINKETGLKSDIGGAVGFLYGNILKSEEQEQAERYQKLIKQGVEPERAFQVATTWKDGVKPADITAAEESSMRWYTTGRNAFIGLELLDLLFVGKPINIALKGMAKGRVVKVFDVVSKAEDAAEARRLLSEQFPDIADKEGVEDLINLARNMNENDSWKKTLADSATGKKLLDELPENNVAKPTTEAQRIFYENGIPVLRGGAASDNVADLVSIRDQVTDAVRGNAEGRRLSTDNILNDEINAGSLPFNTAADGTVDVFTTRNITNPSLGERVALTEGVARASLQGGANVNRIKAKVDDLVRLDDGTFVYAPKKAVTTEFTPQIKAVQEQSRQRVLEAEKRRAQLARDTRVAERQLAEGERRIARQQAEAVLKKEAEKLRIAKDVVANGDARATKVIDETNQRAEELIEKAVKTRDAAKKAIEDRQKKIDELVKKVGDANKARPGIVDNARKAIEKIKNQKKFPKVKFKEEMPLKLQDKKTDIDNLEENVKNHPAAWLQKYVITRGKRKGEFTDEIKNAQGRSMDDAVSENSDGMYQSLEEAKEGYYQYEDRVRELKTKKEVFNEQKGAWKESAENRAVLNLEAYRAQKLQEAREAGEEALKKNLRMKQGVEGQIKTLREEIADIKKSTPELSKTKPELSKPIKAVAKARVDGIKENLKMQKAEAKEVLEKTGETADVPVKPKKKRTPPPVRKESVEYASAKSDVTKEYSKSGMMDESIPGEGGLKPLSGTDKTAASQVNQRIQDEVSMVNELLEKAGVTTETLGIDPAYHRIAKNSVQREKAIERIYKNPEQTYKDFISGKIDSDSALAFIGENLLDHPFVRNNNVRRLAVSKAMKESATGAAQQLQGYSAISKRSYSGIMKQLDDSMIEGMKKNGIDLEKEKNALRSEFEKIVGNYPTADPSDIIREINRLTCPS